jgi:hypothetical protein
MLKEQLILAAVRAAVAITQEPMRPPRVMSEQVARMVDIFLAASVVPWGEQKPQATGHVPKQRGPSVAAVGLDEPWVEDMGHVPWYTG